MSPTPIPMPAAAAPSPGDTAPAKPAPTTTTAAAATPTAPPGGVWDAKTQEMHGGQTWRFCQNFHADFSVTTSPLPTQPAALAAAAASLRTAHHYPPADAADARAALAALAGVDDLAVGNGASEFIDLVMRLAPPGPFRPGPFVASYREYHRAARVAGRAILPPAPRPRAAPGAETAATMTTSSSVTSSSSSLDDAAAAAADKAEEEEEAAISVVIRPNSPTGELLPLAEIERMLDGAPNTLFVFDESFLPFAGADWPRLSAARLLARFPERALVITSWTKIWGCAGLRLGSLAAAPRWLTRVRAAQTPWSCSAPAQAFAVAAAADRAFLDRTRRDVAQWRAATVARVAGRLGWAVFADSVDWAPWVFVTCPDVATARRAVAVAQRAGCPVRPCDSYGLPDRLRIAVRQPQFQEVLFGALEREFGVVDAQ